MGVFTQKTKHQKKEVDSLKDDIEILWSLLKSFVLHNVRMLVIIRQDTRSPSEGITATHIEVLEQVDLGLWTI